MRPVFEELLLLPLKPVEHGPWVITEPTPDHQAVTGRHDVGRIELQAPKLPHQAEDPVSVWLRPFAGQPLGCDSEAPGNRR